MKLSVLALDYDGTIARDDRLDPSVLDAITAARGRGIAVMLVTGRRLNDLRRVAGELHFVDCVVAENGALVHFPDVGLTTTLAPPIPEAFAALLQRQGIEFQEGQCLVEADARFAPQMLDAIRGLELPIVLLFNRSRVMALAQGVSKATGLDAALETLRRSPRNAVAVGDAENDHELLRLAEVGAAVEWGSPSLRAAADIVIAGDGEEIDALRAHCAGCQHVVASAWDVLPTLQLDQAVALPVTAEAGAHLRRFTIGQRLTPHVRHRQKYVDVPVAGNRAFVFEGNGRAAMLRAHTLREFVTALEDLDVAPAEGYLRRGDSSRWIADVLGDHALARELRGYEQEHVRTVSSETLPRIVAAVRSRYELTEEAWP